MNKLKNSIRFALCLFGLVLHAQEDANDTSYKKRVLETMEVEFLSSYYTQQGDNAAVSGGIGNEKLTDATSTFVVSIPLNDDDVLTIDAGVSAYTSASSSNIDPFDGGKRADPFVASSGASRSDLWANLTGTYTHNSDDRNNIVSGKFSVSTEYDYFSLGFGGSYSRLFNEKNTEVSLKGNVYLDTWKTIYPIELRPFGDDGIGFFRPTEITGNPNYNPGFTDLNTKKRNSYTLGLGLSQILHKNLNASMALDLVQQKGLLSTPFQRVYFSDVADSFIEDFHLADDIERLPDSRFKIAAGGRLNWFINAMITVRTFYRYYWDDWGITSLTTQIEVPFKVTDRFTLYPSYRFYQQTGADYFGAYEIHVSTQDYYTSDYDLSDYSANQFGFGASYNDIFTQMHLWEFGLKRIDLKCYKYDRDTTFGSGIVTAGVTFVMD